MVVVVSLARKMMMRLGRVGIWHHGESPAEPNMEAFIGDDRALLELERKIDLGQRRW